MSLFSLTLRGRSFPSDLPLSDVMPLEEFSGNAGGLWKIYRSKLASTKSVSIFFGNRLLILIMSLCTLTFYCIETIPYPW